MALPKPEAIECANHGLCRPYLALHTNLYEREVVPYKNI